MEVSRNMSIFAQPPVLAAALAAILFMAVLIVVSIEDALKH
tara:strand:+ start:9294 stop:9416 length:123 start_codon:yes stop_codon:yes gene_type:complete